MSWLKNVALIRWQRLDARHQLFLSATLVAGAMAVLIAGALWARREHELLNQHEIQMAGDVRALQDDLREFQRLKVRAAPPRLSGQPLLESITASLGSQQLALAATALDAGRVRVKGAANFDAVVLWLAGIQQSHRLTAASLAATRDGAEVIVDIVLVSGVE